MALLMSDIMKDNGWNTTIDKIRKRRYTCNWMLV